GYGVTPTAGRVLFHPIDETAPVQAFPIAGGAASAIAGSSPGDFIVGLNGGALVVHKDGERTVIARAPHDKPEPLVVLATVGVSDAVLLPTGKIAALVIQDTNHDGRFDATDETDVCLIAPSPSAPAPIEARDVPRRLASIVPKLEALTAMFPE